MSDREMQAGLRTFFSGGAYFLDTETLKKVVITASQALLARDEKIPVIPTAHLITTNTGRPECGTYMAAHYRHRRNKERVIDSGEYYQRGYNASGDWELLPLEDDNRYTTELKTVTCGACKASSTYKTLVDPKYKSRQRTAVVHYSTANDGNYRRACKPNEFFWSGAPAGSPCLDPTQVTCKSCKRTQVYKQAIEQMPASSTPATGS